MEDALHATQNLLLPKYTKLALQQITWNQTATSVHLIAWLDGLLLLLDTSMAA